jgi:guanylate kinase
VKQNLEAGYDVILEIDVQGALQVKKRFPQAVYIFIVPPSLEILSERIRGRGTECEEDIRQRLAKAEAELKYIPEYEYLIENNNIAEGVDKLRSIIIAEKCRVKPKQFVF